MRALSSAGVRIPWEEGILSFLQFCESWHAGCKRTHSLSGKKHLWGGTLWAGGGRYTAQRELERGERQGLSQVCIAGRQREQQRHDMGRMESGVDEMKLFKMLFVCFFLMIKVIHAAV